MAADKNPSQIVAGLFVSLKTVAGQRQQLTNKSASHHETELTKYAFRQGLASLEV